jgi:hypothetical protein
MKKKPIGNPREEMIKYIKRFDWEQMSGAQLIKIAAVIAEVEHPPVSVPQIIH